MDEVRKTWDINTIVGLVTLVGMIATAVSVLFGWGGQFNDIKRDFSTLASWQRQWETASKERRGEIERQFGTLSARNDAQDDELNRLSALASQNAYRVAGVEAQGDRLETGLTELAKQLSDQSGDLKVIKEILTRIETSQKNGGGS